jgi:hypothetical protein
MVTSHPGDAHIPSCIRSSIARGRTVEKVQEVPWVLVRHVERIRSTGILYRLSKMFWGHHCHIGAPILPEAMPGPARSGAAGLQAAASTVDRTCISGRSYS